MGVQILAYELIKGLDSTKKAAKIIELVKKGDVVVLEGRLNAEEEMLLTSKALKNVSGKFSGIEIAFLGESSSKNVLEKVKNKVVQVLTKNRFGLTVIGPSKVVKEIKMDPDKLEVLFN